MMRFLSRSVILMRPISSSSPMSPVWNQPSGVDRLRRLLGRVEVALHDLRTADEDLPGLRVDLHLRTGRRPADRAEHEVARAVDRHERRGLGQAVALEHEHPHAVEELADLPRQRRRAGDEVPHPPAGPRADLAEHERIGQAQLERQPRRVRPCPRGGWRTSSRPGRPPSGRSAAGSVTRTRPSARTRA